MNITEARSFALIDQELNEHNLSPSYYEVVRHVIQATGDLGYFNQVNSSNSAIVAGGTALAARIPILVDTPILLAGIEKKVRNTFVNPLFCAAETITRPQKIKSEVAWGMETLALRYPEAIFIVGEDPVVLYTLLQLASKSEIRPALIIGTPAGFLGSDTVKDRLRQSQLPHITVTGRRGGATAGIAIFQGLLSLSWKSYTVRTRSDVKA